MVAEHFRSHHFVLDFSQRSPDYLTEVPVESGVYFIAGKRDEILKVYVGKANSLQRRLEDYHRAFQVHCPNDRKMAFFQDWLARVDPGWELVLHTLSVGSDSVSQTEAEWIRRLDPLVNATVLANEADRLHVHEAFKRYFESFFSKRVQRE